MLSVLTAPSGGRWVYSRFINDFRAQRLSDLSEFPQLIGQRAEIKFKFVVFWSQSLFCDTTCFNRPIGTPERFWVHTAFSYVHTRKLTFRLKPGLARRLRKFANLIFWIAGRFRRKLLFQSLIPTFLLLVRVELCFMFFFFKDIFLQARIMNAYGKSFFPKCKVLVINFFSSNFPFSPKSALQRKKILVN